MHQRLSVNIGYCKERKGGERCPNPMKPNPEAKESMRPNLIEALGYPRELLRNDLELDDCPHNALYDNEDGKCLACLQRSECEWLYQNEEFAALGQKPIAEILAALEIASDYVAAQIAYWEHDNRQCGCTSCSWLRDALRLVDQARAM
jgi:hypothetical protein